MADLTFQNIAIFGAGTMGTAVGQLCVLAGANVTLCDSSPEAIRRAQKSIEADLKRAVAQGRLKDSEEDAARSRLRFESGLVECSGSDLVIETVFEKLDAKQDLLARLESQLGPSAIMATGTNTLSVTAIAAKTRFPERVCGLHFFNPVESIRVVEIVAALQTGRETLDLCSRFIRDLDRQPIIVQDSPGFVVHRCLRPFFAEALRCLHEDVADVRTIDRILREGGGFERGPFEQMDAAGLDTTYAVWRAMWDGFFHDSRFRPHPILKKMIEAGRLGRKSGRGFYEHPNAT